MHVIVSRDEVIVRTMTDHARCVIIQMRGVMVDRLVHTMTWQHIAVARVICTRVDSRAVALIHGSQIGTLKLIAVESLAVIWL